MSPFFDDLEARLRAAAQAGANAPSPPSRRWRRLRWRPARFDAAPVLAAVVVVLVVAGGALALLGHSHHQPSTPPSSPPPSGGQRVVVTNSQRKRLQQEYTYIEVATRGVHAKPACQVHEPTGRSYVEGPPGADLLSILGVLRRPAEAADRLNPSLLTGTPNVYKGYVRRAFSADGASYYIVPARADRANVAPADRCFTLEVAALARYLPKIPARLRAPTQALQTELIAFARSSVDAWSQDTICLVEVSRSSTSSSCGIPAAQVRSGFWPEDDNGTLLGVVPDGVASVTVTFRAARPGQPAHPVVTAAVKSNLYAARLEGADATPLDLSGMTWRAADGRVLKRLSTAISTTQRAKCSQEPVECYPAIASLLVLSSTSSSGASFHGTASAPPTVTSAP